MADIDDLFHQLRAERTPDSAQFAAQALEALHGARPPRSRAAMLRMTTFGACAVLALGAGLGLGAVTPTTHAEPSPLSAAYTHSAASLLDV